MSAKKQNSLTMADFYTNGDNIFKKNLKEIEENLLKSDIILVKKDENKLPTILTETGDFISNPIENKSSKKEEKKQVIFIYSLLLHFYLNYLYFHHTKL